MHRRAVCRGEAIPRATHATRPYETPAERYRRQLAEVTRAGVKWKKKKIMNQREFDLFSAAVAVIEQRRSGYVFPQVSLGETIGCDDDDAYHSINTRRCDLLLTDDDRVPLAVLEYQGSGHNLDGYAKQRDAVKREALKRADLRYVAVRANASNDEMNQIVRQVFNLAERAA